MKKNIILMALIIAVNGISVYSQTLTNTTWSVYDGAGDFLVYFHFGTDTSSFSMDNISYKNQSVFQENKNNFNIVDLIEASKCSITDTGRYTFFIQNDTLKFTLVSDSCSQRMISLTTLHWIRLQTGIHSTSTLHAKKVYPNPVSDYLNIEYPGIVASNKDKYEITSYLGCKYEVKAEYTGQDNIKLNCSGLPIGLYFIKINNQISKFIIYR